MFGAPAFAAAVDFTGNAALTAAYVYRRISQTQGDPTAQTGFKAAFTNGIYGSIWGSGVHFRGKTGASAEVDYVAGWNRALGDKWALDMNVTYFNYPSARVALAYPELIGTVTSAQKYWLMLWYSPDVFATGASGIYTEIGAKLPISDAVRLEIAIGRYDLDAAYGKSYAHARLGAVWAFSKPFKLRVTAHDTDGGGKVLFPGQAGSRLEAAIQASF